MSICMNAGTPILLPFRRLFPGWPRQSLSGSAAIDPVRPVSACLQRCFHLQHAIPGASLPDISHIAGFINSPRPAPRARMARAKSS